MHLHILSYTVSRSAHFAHGGKFLTGHQAFMLVKQSQEVLQWRGFSKMLLKGRFADERRLDIFGKLICFELL